MKGIWDIYVYRPAVFDATCAMLQLQRALHARCLAGFPPCVACMRACARPQIPEGGERHLTQKHLDARRVCSSLREGEFLIISAAVVMEHSREQTNYRGEPPRGSTGRRRV
jgi:hypothetical protein